MWPVYLSRSLQVLPTAPSSPQACQAPQPRGASAASAPRCPLKTGPASPATWCSGLADAHVSSASSSPAAPGPWPCSQLAWLPQAPRTSKDPVPQAQPHSLSSQSLLVEPQKGQEVSPPPAEGCRSAISGAHTTLLLPLKMPCSALLGVGGRPARGPQLFCGPAGPSAESPGPGVWTQALSPAGVGSGPTSGLVGELG